jgi:hypothetical protein
MCAPSFVANTSMVARVRQQIHNKWGRAQLLGEREQGGKIYAARIHTEAGRTQLLGEHQHGGQEA